MAIDNATILDAIWVEGSNDYQQRIPLASKAGVSQVQDALFSPMNRQLWNEFETGLINRIGSVIAADFNWENPLAIFKREELLPMGSTIEEYAFDLIEASGYDVRDSNLFKVNPGKVYSAFHTVNRKDRYDISVNQAEVAQAFVSSTGLNDFITRKLAIPGKSDAYDEYRVMIQLIAEAFSRNRIYNEQSVIADLNAPTETELKRLSQKIREHAKLLTLVPTKRYNSQRVPMVSNKEDLVLFTTPKISSNLDVNVLADSFNIDRADFANRVVEIDEFPIAGVHAMLVDKNWFVYGDFLREVSSFWNAQNLVYNYYLHHWGVYSVSPFEQAVIFSNENSTTYGTVEVDLTGITASLVDSEGNPVTTWTKGDELPQLIVTGAGNITGDDEGNFILPSEYTKTITISAGTDPGDPEAPEKNSRTYVDRVGQVHFQANLKATNVVEIVVESAYIDPSGDGSISNTYTDTVSVTIA